MENKKTNYFGPFLSMVFLFLIVGFLTTANSQFQGPLKEAFLSNAGSLKNTFATLITFSWFLAYPICGPIGSSWVNKYGYKGTLIRGLILMTVGLLLFFASSEFTVRFPDAVIGSADLSFPAGFLIFLLGSFVAGASATILQVVINPYLVACDVKGTQSIQRLAIGGTANSVGTTIAPYFVTGIVFGGMAMEEVQVTQLAVPFISLAAVIVLVTLALMKFSLPDIQGTRAENGEKLEKSVWSFRHLTLGVIAIFFYVGAEVCVGANVNMYAIEKGMASPALLATIYWGGMLAGRDGKHPEQGSATRAAYIHNLCSLCPVGSCDTARQPVAFVRRRTVPLHNVGCHLHPLGPETREIYLRRLRCVYDRGVRRGSPATRTRISGRHSRWLEDDLAGSGIL